MNNQLEYFATCPKGFEALLAGELKRLKAQRVRPLKGGVAFFGSKSDGYRICLWSRIASRILRVVDRVSAESAEALYSSVKTISWDIFVGPNATISVSARGKNEALRNTQFAALKVKDAICDCLREKRGSRPNVEPTRPDVPVWVSIHNKKATISIDYAGESLHRRGYRTQGESVEAPLKEALAAGMLVWGGWDKLASPRYRRAQAQRLGVEGVVEAPTFVDPTCGSATLVIEAAMMATDRAPGLSRDYWGFEGCADFDAEAFDDLLADADERFEAGLENAPNIIGIDIDPKAIKIAEGNARRAGLGKLVQFVCASCEYAGDVLNKCEVDLEHPGFIACNPPYGVRLLQGELGEFYKALSAGLQPFSSEWSLCVITPDKLFDSAVGFDAVDTLSVYNGAIEATLRKYQLGSSFKETLSLLLLDGKEVEVTVSSSHAQQFADRLRKMIKTRRKWARKHAIHAYRVYDSDLPDYAVAIEVFEEKDTLDLNVLVTEYQAPKEIDPQLATRRFMDACSIAQVLFEVDDDHLFTRVRKQDKGGSQYKKEHRQNHCIVVEEAGLPFELDLSGYLDTGLFLDHRITRGLVGNMAKGKSFLNLFAYTGTASVYAAACGATQTTTVDMSQTYLEWARRNMQRAGFSGGEHQFIRADVLAWVEHESQTLEQASYLPEETLPSAKQVSEKAPQHYDVIFLDPPTFSNSKTMGKRSWDIQRDHVALLNKVVRLLNNEGVIVFSGNLRSFKLDEQAVSAMGLQIENITAQTIPEDFSRNPRIHFCYVLTKTSEE